MTINPNISRRGLRHVTVVFITLTALSGAVAITAGLRHDGAWAAVELTACGVSALALYRVSRLLDANADRSVLTGLASGPAPVDELAADLGLRVTVVRLSLTRLLNSGQVLQDAHGGFRLLDR